MGLTPIGIAVSADGGLLLKNTVIITARTAAVTCEVNMNSEKVLIAVEWICFAITLILIASGAEVKYLIMPAIVAIVWFLVSIATGGKNE